MKTHYIDVKTQTYYCRIVRYARATIHVENITCKHCLKNIIN